MNAFGKKIGFCFQETSGQEVFCIKYQSIRPWGLYRLYSDQTSTAWIGLVMASWSEINN